MEQRRALYPDGSAYRTGGLFVQDAVTIVPDRLRVVLGGRYTRVRAETSADRNRRSAGRELGVLARRVAVTAAGLVPVGCSRTTFRAGIPPRGVAPTLRYGWRPNRGDGRANSGAICPGVR